MLRKWHNALSKDDVKTLLNSSECSRSTPDGYVNRLIVSVGRCFGISLSAMHDLTLDQFTRAKMSGKRFSILQLKWDIEQVLRNVSEVGEA